MSGASRERLAFVGDVHLDRDDPDLAAFLRFLDALGATCRRIVLLGDLFNLWIGRPEIELPHQSAVVRKLRELRDDGVVVRYVEGNRDYRIGSGYTGTAFDLSTDRGISERFGGRSLFAVHGDLVNTGDRQYRAWRRFSRSAPAWGLFHLIPRSLGMRWAERLERRMRGTNLTFKAEFAEEAVRAYAAPWLRDGHDAVVLGHFHVEKDLVASDPPGRILVLPEWKGSRRHLEVGRDGSITFVDSPG